MSASSLGIVTLVEIFVMSIFVFYWSSFLPQMVVFFYLCLLCCQKENHRTDELFLSFYPVLRAWLYEQGEQSLWSLPEG